MYVLTPTLAQREEQVVIALGFAFKKTFGEKSNFSFLL
jgi:hypothetical protein